MTSTRRTPACATSSWSRVSSTASFVSSRTGRCGTGSSPEPRTATQVESVSRQVCPGMWLTYISVPCVRNARHASSCTLSCQVISTEALCASAAIACLSSLAASRALCGETVAGDDIRLVLEPETAVPLQHFARCVEIARVAHDRLEPLVLDLRDIDRGVPSSEQCGGPDRRADLRGQRMHVIAETRALIGVGVEVEAARLSTERLLGCLEELMPVHLERILARPDPLDDLEARIPSAG